MADNGAQAHENHDRDTYSAARTAEVLGLGKRRVLQMLERGELPASKDDTGRWVVFAPHVHALLRERQQQDRRKHQEERQEEASPRSDEVGRELIDSLKDQVQHLRHELDAEREANRENRRIIAGLIERIPELEAPRDASGSPEKPAEEPPKDTRPEPHAKPQTGAQRRSWWWRIVGG